MTTYRIETKEGKVLGRYFDLATARRVKQRLFLTRHFWVNIIGERFTQTKAL